MSLKAKVHFLVDVVDPEASLYILNENHVAILVATTSRQSDRSGRFQAGEDAVFSFSFDNVLAPGRYSPVLTLAHRGSGLDVMDRFEGQSSFVVTGLESLGGMIDLPVLVGIAAADDDDTRELRA